MLILLIAYYIFYLTMTSLKQAATSPFCKGLRIICILSEDFYVRAKPIYFGCMFIFNYWKLLNLFGSRTFYFEFNGKTQTSVKRLPKPIYKYESKPYDMKLFSDLNNYLAGILKYCFKETYQVFFHSFFRNLYAVILFFLNYSSQEHVHVYIRRYLKSKRDWFFIWKTRLHVVSVEYLICFIDMQKLLLYEYCKN